MPSFEYEATNSNGERVRSIAFGRTMQDVVLTLSGQGLQIISIEDAYAKHDSLRATGAPETPVTNYDAPNQAPMPAQADVLLDPRIYAPTVNREVPSEVAAPQIEPIGQPRELPPVGKRNPFLTNIFGPIAGRVPLKDLSFFFRQFGTMIEAGVPMVQSLDTLSSQAGNMK